MDNPAYKNTPSHSSDSETDGGESTYQNSDSEHEHANIKAKNLPFAEDLKAHNDEIDNGSTDQTGKAQQTEHQLYANYDQFRYTSFWNQLLMALGIATTCLGALAVPYSIMISNSSPTILLLFGSGMNLTNASFQDNTNDLRTGFIAFGVGYYLDVLAELILFIIAVNSVNSVAHKQITIIRIQFLKVILRQDMSWYDTSTHNNFGTNLEDNLSKMKEGMGEAVVTFHFYIMPLVWSVVVTFIYGWELALCVLTCCTCFMLSTELVERVQSLALTDKELNAYSVARVIATEIFASIRTVFAFSDEQNERYGCQLDPAEGTRRNKGLSSDIGDGMMRCIIYYCYAIVMWYGVKLIFAEREVDEQVVLVIVLFGVIMGAQICGFASIFMKSFAGAKARREEELEGESEKDLEDIGITSLEPLEEQDSTEEDDDELTQVEPVKKLTSFEVPKEEEELEGQPEKDDQDIGITSLEPIEHQDSTEEDDDELTQVEAVKKPTSFEVPKEELEGQPEKDDQDIGITSLEPIDNQDSTEEDDDELTQIEPVKKRISFEDPQRVESPIAKETDEVKINDSSEDDLEHYNNSPPPHHTSTSQHGYPLPPQQHPSTAADVWVNTNSNYMPTDAIHAGHDADLSTIFVCRAFHAGDLIPGKFVPNRSVAYVCHGGQELEKDYCEVLVGDQHAYMWVESANGILVQGSVVGGRTATGEPLYVGRAHFAGTLTPGKIHCSHNCLYIPYDGQEHRIQNYEVLVRKSFYYSGRTI